MFKIKSVLPLELVCIGNQNHKRFIWTENVKHISTCLNITITSTTFLAEKDLHRIHIHTCTLYGLRKPVRQNQDTLELEVRCKVSLSFSFQYLPSINKITKIKSIYNAHIKFVQPLFQVTILALK